MALEKCFRLLQLKCLKYIASERGSYFGKILTWYIINYWHIVFLTNYLLRITIINMSSNQYTYIKIIACMQLIVLYVIWLTIGYLIANYRLSSLLVHNTFFNHTKNGFTFKNNIQFGCWSRQNNLKLNEINLTPKRVIWWLFVVNQITKYWMYICK